MMFSSPLGAEVISTCPDCADDHATECKFSSPLGAEVISTYHGMDDCSFVMFASSRPLSGLRSFQPGDEGALGGMGYGVLAPLPGLRSYYLYVR